MKGYCIKCGKAVDDMPLVTHRGRQPCPYCCGVKYRPRIPTTLPAERPYQERAAALAEKRDS